ncbi:MAG: ATP-dependent Clp protease ATP-binding subunit, partial [Clostridia bacterium]|nr:ATP-dependent Clp protease ATP-binding subunit [Clostridia bacterium]
MNNKMICSKCKKRPAVIFVSRVDGENTTQEGFCLKCATELNIGPIKQMMQNMGITEDDIEAVSEQFGDMMDNMDDFQLGGAGTMPFMQNLFNGNNPIMSNDKQNDNNTETEVEDADEEASDDGKNDKKKKGKRKTKRKFLNSYCTDLTAKAREGKIDRIIGRETEIYRVTQILCRRTKNNPCLIGEPGVGKTAIAEGLALKIAAGEVPARIADKEIHLLDL